MGGPFKLELNSEGARCDASITEDAICLIHELGPLATLEKPELPKCTDKKGR